MPLFFTLSFHLLSLFIRSPLVSAITTKTSAYNSYGEAALNSVDEGSMKCSWNKKQLKAKTD